MPALDDRFAVRNPFVKVEANGSMQWLGPIARVVNHSTSRFRKGLLMKTNLLQLTAVAVAAFTSLTASALPPIYMDFEGLPGIKLTEGKKGKEIEIQSWSLGATNSSSGGNRVQGNRIGTDAAETGPFKFSVKGTPSTELRKVCASRQPLGNVMVDIDGAKHHFQNATFTSCQSGDGSIPTDQFSLNFSRCAFHGGVSVAAGDVNARSSVQPNGRLIGLPSGPLPVHVESLTLNGTGATLKLTKMGAGTLVLSGANAAPLPKLELVLTNGPKWTFYKITMTDLIVSSATGQSAPPTDQFSLNFATMEGPPSGYPAR
jgi:type VI protein secretion system component Hcp